MKRATGGFTIVELIVVTVVIGTLVVITIFAFGNWRHRNAIDVLTSDLKHLSAAMEAYRNVNNAYPVTASAINGVYNSADSSKLETGMSTMGPQEYCITYRSMNDPSVVMHIIPRSDPIEGGC